MNSVKPLVHIVSGPAAVGKTTICSELLFRHANKIERIITTTTRSKREWEIDGIHYYFLDRAEFERRTEMGEFIEYALVHINLYGSTESELKRILEVNKEPLYIIDIQGMVHLKAELHRRGYDVKTYFLDAPMMELERRMLLRNTESEESFRARVASALVEKEQAPLYDHIIENIELETALENLAKCMGLEA